MIETKFKAFHQIKRDVLDHEAKEKNKHYWFTVNKFQYTTWVPQAREGAVLVRLPNTNRFFLYGGVA
jgi:hypothetical protein